MIHEVAIPAGSDIARHTPGAYFADAFSTPFAAAHTPALQIYLDQIADMPPWVSRMMLLRNKIVQLVGLKDLGGFALQPGQSRQPQAGDRIGIFTLLSVRDEEIVLGDTDKHLDVWLSVRRPGPEHPGQLVVSTVVKVHNGLGRFYMFFVGPMHKRIVPAVLARAARR